MNTARLTITVEDPNYELIKQDVLLKHGIYVYMYKLDFVVKYRMVVYYTP